VDPATLVVPPGWTARRLVVWATVLALVGFAGLISAGRRLGVLLAPPALAAAAAVSIPGGALAAGAAAALALLWSGLMLRARLHTEAPRRLFAVAAAVLIGALAAGAGALLPWPPLLLPALAATAGLAAALLLGYVLA
jgi:hypothetical protein